MARELNRELFGGFGNRDNANQESAGTQPAQPVYAKADEVRVLHLHIESLSKRMKEFESRVEVLTTKVEDMVTQNKQRFERVQGHFQRQTEMMQNAFNDVNAKMAQVVSRVNERKVSDGVVKEMVERQASLVQTFEVRMSQLQRVISEQEMQLMSARTELKEALQELTRLKKL
jgi:chromosome segregation ATPase